MTFTEYLLTIENIEQREKLAKLLDAIKDKYPHLKETVKWNQPMFTDHGTFIIGFSAFKNNISIAPEKVIIDAFSDEIISLGYTHTKQLIKYNWDQEWNLDLIYKIIDHNILTKKDITSFWR